MMNRFMELFRCNARPRHPDVVARDYATLRRANYERDDRKRAAGIDFSLIFRRSFQAVGSRATPPAAPAELERRG